MDVHVHALHLFSDGGTDRDWYGDTCRSAGRSIKPGEEDCLNELNIRKLTTTFAISEERAVIGF